MDRTTLKYFLAAGPAKKYAVLDFYKQALRDNPAAPETLFRATALNKCILFKFLVTDPAERSETSSPIRTLVFFPYDDEQPGDGGESFFFSAHRLREYWSTRSGDTLINTSDLEPDIHLLELLDRIPTFNPFLMGDALERAGIVAPAIYVGADADYARLVTSSIRDRIRPLIVAAMGGRGMDSAIDRFVEHIWKLDEPEKIRPLVQALGLPVDSAHEILHSWCGLTFFEQEFEKLQPELRTAAEWLAKFPRPSETLPPDLRQLVDMAAQSARSKIHENWRAGQSTLSAFQASYDEFVGPARNVGGFVRFLKDSKRHFWSVGEVLGKLEQSVYAWRTFTRGRPKTALPYDRLMDLYTLINQAS
ncbi:MAG: hypothetical protein AAGH48_10050 [Pseudomonadota bacterium]